MGNNSYINNKEDMDINEQSLPTLEEKKILQKCNSDLFENVDFFLGAGASIASDIPSGREMVLMLKRDFYCLETNKNKSDYSDFKSHIIINEIQTYIDKGYPSFPKKDSDEEYSFYFEKCYPNESERDAFIQHLIEDKTPSPGYLDLSAILLSSKLTKTIWTTNFDDLVSAGFKSINSNFTIREYSNDRAPNLRKLREDNIPTLCRLHGDIKYDHTKNTSSELDNLESDMEECFKHILTKKALFVIGYSGIDNSIMSFFEKNLNESDFLSKGLYWFNVKNGWLSDRVKNLLETLKRLNKPCAIVEIESFDIFMEHLKNSLGVKIEDNKSNILNPGNLDINKKVSIYKSNLRKKNVYIDNIYEKFLFSEKEQNGKVGILEFQKEVISLLEKYNWSDFPNIILKGIAGMGKTTEMKLLYNKILDDYENIKPIYFDLENYTSITFNCFFEEAHNYLLFIDGFEEFKDSIIINIFKDIKNILSIYKNVRIIISGRGSSFFDNYTSEYKFIIFQLQPYIDTERPENIKLQSRFESTAIKNYLDIPLFRNIAENGKIDIHKPYNEQYYDLVKTILSSDNKIFSQAANVSARIDKDFVNKLTNITECLVKLSKVLLIKNKLYFSENELNQICKDLNIYEFLLKSSLFNYINKDKIEFVSIFYFYYFIYFYISDLSYNRVKKLFFSKSGKIKEKQLDLFYNVLKLSKPYSLFYSISQKTLGSDSSTYILLTDFTYISDYKRLEYYKTILSEYNQNNNLIYYGRFEKSHDLLRNIDSLSDSMHKLLPEEFYDEAVKLHCDTINNFLQNPTSEDITIFENAVILLGVHDKFWKEKQYHLLKEVAVPLIQFFRENEIAKKMKGLLSEDIILSWYEDYGWTNNWEEKEWAIFIKKITNIDNTEFFSFKDENEFRIKLKLFNHFHSNIFIRKLLIPLTIKILKNKIFSSGEASFVPNSLDDDFETPAIHFDNDVSYFSYTIKTYEIPISDLLYILNSIDCNYAHHNTAYQLEELYKDLLNSFKDTISKIKKDEIPALYALFKKYINTDEGIFISDFNAYIKLLNDNQKEILFDLLLSDLKQNTNWQTLWMLHNSIVILLDIKNKNKAIFLCKKLKGMDRVYGECIADIYIPNLKEHPLYELSKKEYPLIFPQTVKKEKKHKARLSQFEAKKKAMLEKEIYIITNKEKFLFEVNNIFKYLDKTKDGSERDTDRGRLLDLQVDYIGNRIQYAYKEEYKIPKIFSSFALTYLCNFTKHDQSLNRLQAIKNIEDWFSDDKYFWRYFFWLYICHYKKEETDDFLNKNPSLIKRITESMQQEVSYFSAENDLSLYDGGRNRFWIVPFVHYLSRFYNNKLPEWFDKSKILNFIAYPAWQLSTGYGVHVNGDFKWESWNSVFDWIQTVSDIDEDMIVEKSLSIIPELKSDQSITQIVTIFVEKIKTNKKYKQQMLEVIIGKTIEELQKDYKDHNEKPIMNGGALSSFWRETQEEFIDRLYPYVDFSKYNLDDINYCRQSVFEYICKNVNEKQKAKIIDSLRNRISEKNIRIYLTKLGYDKAIILTINDFLNGENFNTDYAFYSSLFGKANSSLRLLNKYFQLYEYSLEKRSDRRNYLIGYAKEGILQTTTKNNFWFIKKKLNKLITILKAKGYYFEGVEDFLNEIEQRIFDDDRDSEIIRR